MIYELYIENPSNSDHGNHDSDDHLLVERYIIDPLLGQTGYLRACSLMESKDYNGKTLDVGVIGAYMDIKQIREFLKEMYKQPAYLQRVLRKTAPLEKDREYLLIATEILEADF